MSLPCASIQWQSSYSEYNILVFNFGIHCLLEAIALIILKNRKDLILRYIAIVEYRMLLKK